MMTGTFLILQMVACALGDSCWLPVYASEIVTSDDLEAYGDDDNGNQQLALLRSKLLM